VIVDYILAGLAAEGVGLVAYRAITGRGPRSLVANFGAGAAFLVAWRLSESGASIAWVCAALSAALVAHLTDLVARWRESEIP
jgi:hypothetical protein